MKYVALLRGINVGKSVKINMKDLKAIFEYCGYTGVVTYINSGNVFFEADDAREAVKERVEGELLTRSGMEVRVLIKTWEEVVAIANSIPEAWKNDDEQKTDVAYLFASMDHEGIIDQLPVNRDLLQVKYVSGALIWNVSRENYHRSQLNKIIGHRIYQDMTVRNVNTARYLSNHYTGASYGA